MGLELLVVGLKERSSCDEMRIEEIGEAGKTTRIGGQVRGSWCLGYKAGFYTAYSKY